MILGTPRRWWIATGLLFGLGLGLLGTGAGGILGTVAGVLLVIVAMLVFAVAPVRYGRGAGKPTTASTAPAPAAPTIPVATDAAAPDRGSRPVRGVVALSHFRR